MASFKVELLTDTPVVTHNPHSTSRISVCAYKVAFSFIIIFTYLLAIISSWSIYNKE